MMGISVLGDNERWLMVANTKLTNMTHCKQAEKAIFDTVPR